mmetsp:Transcript_3064/g.8709  ORF Transcript_3064/g.8709 Transcript_3064/m.8709 type:complete len:239 (+) Transcript_3064:274-990(+)|eukprot:CAMPEP_0117671348 /NCGR_PEP_ID=MMETSP0804-20121206/13283_1 /TAXON_ID=1074897 /ORGANISM="Tetraselmis astigmatica, Strain CCMP880" /LENGTH=238 /DNA_ID=CAMNT_0005479797 /DNA_START=205 /DNA_END=921 /DNA_ORIENTATION=-
MGAAKNPPPKYRQKPKGWRSRKCLLVGGAAAAVAITGLLAVLQVSRLGEQVLEGAAADLALRDLQTAMGMFEGYHNETLQALAVFRLKGYADFYERWVAAGLEGRQSFIQVVQMKLRRDPLFREVADDVWNASKQLHDMVPEMFAENGGFLAYDDKAFKVLLGKIMRREENDGHTDDELKRLTSVAKQFTGTKAKLYEMQRDMRLSVRSLIMAKFQLTLAAEVMAGQPQQEQSQEGEL